MRWLNGLVVALLLAATGSACAQDRIRWLGNVNEAQQLARQSQRLVLVHFWDHNCPPCVRMERQVFNRPEVIRALSTNYVPVKINVSENRDLASQYKVTRWPTDVILDPQGKEVYRGIPTPDPRQFTATLDNVAAHSRLGQTIPGNDRRSSWESDGSASDARRDSAFVGGATQVSQTPLGYRPNYQSGAGSNPGYGLPSTSPRPATTNPAYGQSIDPANPQLQSGTQGGGFSPGNRGNRAGQPNSPPARPAEATQNPYARSTLDPYSPPSQPTESATPTNDGSLNVGGARVGNPGGYGGPTGVTVSPDGLQQSQYQPNSTVAADNAATTPQDYQGPAAGVTNTQGPQMQSNLPPQTQQNQFHSNHTPQRRAPANTSTAPAGPPKMGLEGYCPVTLVDQEVWKPGDPTFGAIHIDRTYLFASQVAQQKFLANPGRYAPVISGYDAVTFVDQRKLVTGTRKFGAFYNNRVYLFSSEANMNRFFTKPDMYDRSVFQLMQNRR